MMLKLILLTLSGVLLLTGCQFSFSEEKIEDSNARHDFISLLDRAQKHLFEIKLEDTSLSLRREHATNRILLEIPSIIKSWSYRTMPLPEAQNSNARNYFELSMQYLRALRASTPLEAKAAIAGRLKQLLDYEVAKALIKYDSLLKQYELLNKHQKELSLIPSLSQELIKLEEDLANQLMEVRTLCNISMEENFLFMALELKVTEPLTNSFIETILNNRPEFKNASISRNTLDEMNAILARPYKETGLNLLHHTEQILRLPRELEARRLAEKKISLESIELLEVCGVILEVEHSYARFLASKKSYEEISAAYKLTPLDLNLALLKERWCCFHIISYIRLLTDLGILTESFRG